MEQNLRIADLVSFEATGTRIVAGSDGADRRVLWAHSCEMPDPDRWLGPSELLMTVGLCIPPDSAGQVDLVRRLAQAGLAGMMVGDNQVAPELTPQMLAEANRLSFPLMITTGAVPFASVGRIVAAANATNQTQQILMLSRLYQAVLDSHQERDGFMLELGRVLHVSMCAIDVTTGSTVLPGGLHLDPEELDEVVFEVSRVGPDRTARVGALRQGRISVWRIPAHRHTLLLVGEGHGSMLDSFTVVHLSRVVAGEVNRRAAASLAVAQRGRQLLTEAYTGTARAARLDMDARELSLQSEDLVVAVVLPERGELLVEALSLAEIPHASAARKGYLVSVLNAEDLTALGPILSFHGIRAGISPHFNDFSEVREAALRAQWAYESVQTGAATMVHYDEASFSISPRSESEAKEIIERVLGPLCAGRGTDTILLDTLCAFLDADRSWSATAEALGVHRQTLAYRLGRIEKLTGRSLKSTRDLAELWVARVTLKQQ